MDNTCSICNFLQTPTNQILVTDSWSVGLTNDQPYLGRARVTLRNHKANLGDLSSEEMLDFLIIVKRVEVAYKGAFGSDLLNWACLMNKEYRNPEPNPHLYWHIFPRYSKSVQVGSTLFEDAEYGSHYDPAKIQTVDNETLAAIISKLSKALN